MRITIGRLRGRGLSIAVGLWLLTSPVLGEDLGAPEGDEAVENTEVSPVVVKDPVTTIEAFNDAIRQAIQTPEDAGFAVRHEIMKKAVSEAFDMPVMARRTINRMTWKGLRKEQTTTYIDTLQTYQAAILADRFKPGAKVDFAIDEVVDGRRKTKLVKTRIVRTDDEDVGLNYLMIEREDRWRVVDVFLNSTISEVAMRRSEYSAIVSEQGFDALIEALNGQIAELMGEGAEAVPAQEDVSVNEDAPNPTPEG